MLIVIFFVPRLCKPSDGYHPRINIKHVIEINKLGENVLHDISPYCTKYEKEDVLMVKKVMRKF